MKTALVIGGSGYLGKHVLAELSAHPVKIFAVENSTKISGLEKEHIIKGGIRAVTTKLLNKIQPDTVFHCARPTLPQFKRLGRKISAYYAAFYNNQLIQHLQDSTSRPELVFASGSLMYGNSLEAHDEDSPLRPISYARQYAKGEEVFYRAARSGAYPVKMLRFPWLLGNGSWFDWFYLKTMAQHNAVPLFGEGENLMEIVDIRDAARTMVLAGLNENLQGIINIPSKKAITQKEFAGTIAAVFDMEVVDSGKIFKKIEYEAMQAFTSNITLTSKWSHFQNGLSFIPLENTLTRIKLEQK